MPQCSLTLVLSLSPASDGAQAQLQSYASTTW